MNMRIVGFLLGVWLLGVIPVFLSGQASAQSHNQRATLMGWEQRTLNFMLDRSHNYGGTHFNRGLFRDNINAMSPEHEIDLLTYRYTLIDEYEWHTSGHGYRLSVGSLNATNFAIENKLKVDYSPGSRHTLLIDGTHEENLRADRFLFRLGYEYRFGERNHAGLEHTLGRDKSDLDLTLYYRYGDLENGMVHAGITWLDYAAGVVQGLAEDSNNEFNERYDYVFDYSSHPLLFNLKLVTPQLGRFRLELLGGLQSYLEKEVRQVLNGGDDFIDREWAHYAGALLEFTHPFGLAGLTYQRRFSKLNRTPANGSDFPDDFTNRQFSDKVGVFATGNYRNFTVEQWLWHARNVDSLQGDAVPGDLSPDFIDTGRQPFFFEEKRLLVKSRLLYGSPTRGVQAGLEFHADYRYPQGEPHPDHGVRNFDFRQVYPIVRNRNDRLTLTVGYRFHQHFTLETGVSYDLDRDKQSGIGFPREAGTWFDGGFGRMSLKW